MTYTVALDAWVPSVTVTVWVPAALGGKNNPAVVIVPVAGLPPTTPSTDHTWLPPLPPVTPNCWLRDGVNTDTRGVMENPAPVPVRVTVCGAPAALSPIETAALRAPAANGENVTSIVHVLPGASEAPHVLVCAKSAPFTPVSVMLPIVSGAVPLLVYVMRWAPLVVPVATLPKSMLVRLKVTDGNVPDMGLATSA